MSLLDRLLAQKRPPSQVPVKHTTPIAEFLRRPAAHPKPVVANNGPSNTLLQMIHKVREEGNPSAWADIRRITDVPLWLPISEEQFADANRRWVLGGAKMGGDPFVLKTQQAQAILDYERFGGVFAKIGVGKGKTFITLMVAQAAFERGEAQRILLLVPSHVFAQLTQKDIPQARRLIRLTLPIHRLGDMDASRRRMIAKSSKRGLYILPYSMLSAPKYGSEILSDIGAQLIIADECQQIAARRSARGGRFLKYCREKQPRLCVLSGTITRKSVKDYHHLATLALRDNSFLPYSPQITAEWAAVIDSAGSTDSRTSTGPLRPLIDWAVQCFPDDPLPLDLGGFRKAFRLRMDHTPGVISSGDEDVSSSLVIRNLPVPDHKEHPDWPELQVFWDQVLDAWLTPSGDEIEHAIHMYKWLWELSAGFYNNLVWPEASDLAARRGISEDEAEGLLDRAKTCHDAHQDYARALRTWLGAHSLPGLDTPFLVGSEMSHHGAVSVGHDLYAWWMRAKDLEDPELPERDSYPVRVCGYKIEHAVKWAMDGKRKCGGIVWYHHQEIGRWLVEMMRGAGLDPLHCPAGRRHNETILDSDGRIVVASIRAHSTGKNLQMHGEQLIVQWPRGADVAEQMIGRTHRMGQERDEVFVDTNNTTGWDHENMAATLNDALYVHQTAQPQKLIYAVYNPVPVVMPFGVLKERGFQPHELSPEMQAMLATRFEMSER